MTKLKCEVKIVSVMRLGHNFICILFLFLNNSETNSYQYKTNIKSSFKNKVIKNYYIYYKVHLFGKHELSFLVSFSGYVTKKVFLWNFRGA